ncbi:MULTISPECIES: hypothetical protein [unclassified Chelatococcus]|uniref:hypothetical protein n=1 Tax=unclassified Chelatococcus TaxID=2638111 RepID=UPI001BCA94B7|nr:MULTISPECIES: hypothetical protein [unclassified Chelatococcus]MBS7743720.1 hypothetical protein [Chelatococcus sp. HY11]MBX3547438.1 hypothetical protein [Chelatococcus sp.]CAH1664628.1 conserved hypothetical protein [Hyphomicrobiales bacterium]CAH1688389.1 conserved hypothetical protein [Hyphomicrobiales bacterium]
MEATTPQMRSCPYCSETINAQSKKCRHCGEILDPQMRELEMLKKQQGGSQVFMNAGGGGAAAAASAVVGYAGPIKRFPHWLHIILSILTGGLWLPVYLLLYVFRNKRYYF